MIIEDKPKVFISYSWSSTSIVLAIAERLMVQGVDVILDKWALKEGQDKYAFMEKCVNDESVDRVLIISDKAYTEKANKRIGGVGDETIVISGEIYGNAKQDKFIPVVVECDSEGKPYLPAYIKSRIYIDLSENANYEEGYEKLLRNIYERPLFKKPKLGKKPEWLDDDTAETFLLDDLCRQLSSSDNEGKTKVLINRFLEEHLNQLINLYDASCCNGETVFCQFQKTKPIRDRFLDFVDILEKHTSINKGELLSQVFEDLYNKLTLIKTFDASSTCVDESVIEVYKIYIWELFICTVAYYKYRGEFVVLNSLLVRNYFVKTSVFGGKVQPTLYTVFCHYSSIIEDRYKKMTERGNKITLLGDEVCKNREKKPVYDGLSIARADLFLYQVFNAFNFAKMSYWGNGCWFPQLYIYADQDNIDDWIRLKSRRYCLRLNELFGVANKNELKSRISSCMHDNNIRYKNTWIGAKNILDYIKIDEVGVLN